MTSEGSPGGCGVRGEGLVEARAYSPAARRRGGSAPTTSSLSNCCAPSAVDVNRDNSLYTRKQILRLGYNNVPSVKNKKKYFLVVIKYKISGPRRCSVEQG